MKTIKVAYITDEQYAMPTFISAFSLRKNKGHDEKAVVYMICDSLSEDSKEIFKSLEEDNFEIKLLDVFEQEYRELADTCLFSKTIHVSSTALFKMNLPELLFQEDRVLYLDGDTIIQKSLYELYTTNIEDHYIAAVDDQFDTFEDGYSDLCKRLNLERRHYFNSGVMLLNLEKMRCENISGQLLDYRRNGINYFMDQDCFNAVLGKRLVTVPAKNNLMSTIFDTFSVEEIGERFLKKRLDTVAECMNEAVVLHLTDRRKPWRYNMPWFSGLFFSYYNESPLADKRIELLSPIKELKSENLSLKKQLKDASKHLGYILPYDKIQQGKAVILYGAGRVGKSYKRQLDYNKFWNLVCWVDKRGDCADMEAAEPEEILRHEYDYILIAVENHETAFEIQRELQDKYSVEKEKIAAAF